MRAAAVAALGLAAGAVAAGVFVIGDDDSAGSVDPGGPASTATATTTITRRDLVETAVEDGTLGYADIRDVVNRTPGTITWLPAVGRVIGTDGVLYRVDESPVILMDGRIPAYRRLGPGLEGRDVRQLERSLRESGHDPDDELVIDDVWDAATTDAVVRWQDAHELTQTGTIELGRLVFLPGPRRVSEVNGSVGVPSGPSTGGVPPEGSGGPPGAGGDVGGGGAPVLTTTSTRRRVTVLLDTTKSELARKGARVIVELPSEKRVAGRISSVGKVATRTGPLEEAADSSEVTATIEVKIRLATTGSGLDQAPVTVSFEKSRRKDVLAVPVTALLARPGGKFAVQLVQGDDEKRVVSVTAGLYAAGFVEIAGARLEPGLRVSNAALR